jgi:phosphoglucomutase
MGRNLYEPPPAHKGIARAPYAREARGPAGPGAGCYRPLPTEPGGPPNMVDISHVRASLEAIASRPEHAEEAARNIARWRQEPAFAPWRPLLEAVIGAGEWDLLLDSFYRVLPFGTGGRRGPVGLGPNRMNPWTLGTSVQGNIDFLRDRFGADAPLSVVIASDVRVYRDLRGALPKGVDNPLLGMTSVELAKQAACIYAANGVDVHMLEPTSGKFLATPELSFLIRRLGCQGGLNVSASHNHPDDNGGKFYTEQGAQEVPPHDERMVERVQAVDSVTTMPWADACASGRVRFLDGALHEAYLQDVSRVLRGTARGAKIVFTNLHGVGDLAAGAALERAGFDVHYVPSQRAHDGLFPGVKFRAPNPEYPTAFEPAVALAREIGADLILATDPDADRIGAMVPDPRDPDGPYRFFTGNELSSLIAAARFQGAAPGKVGIKTEVTTQLFSRVVAAAGGQVVSHLLVGCKYIAGVMRELETTGRYGDVVAGLDDVLIGTEESHGFLLSTNIRDKDSAAPALVLAELASERKAAGSTLLAALEELYRAHGAVANVQLPLVMAGAVGRQRIEAIQDGMRAAPPSQIAGRTVTAFHDRRDPEGVFGPIVSETDRASRDVLVFELGPDHRLVIRPSGTEPKTKIYAEAVVPAGEDLAASLAEAERQANDLALDFVAQALAIVGLDLPPEGLRCSPLLGVDERMAFAREVLPQAVRRARSGEEIPAWLRSSLGGADGVGLTAPGVRWWLLEGEGSALPAPVADALATAWGLRG